MKKSADVVVQKINNEYMIVPVIDGVVQMGQVYCISDTGAFIWESILDDGDMEISELVALVAQKYNVLEEAVKEDVIAFLTDLKEHNLILGNWGEN